MKSLRNNCHIRANVIQDCLEGARILPPSGVKFYLVAVKGRAMDCEHKKSCAGFFSILCSTWKPVKTVVRRATTSNAKVGSVF